MKAASISCFHNPTTQARSAFMDTTKKKTKCSLFRLEHPGTKIASYIILNENQSPLSGPGVETDLSACFLGGKKVMQSKEHLHQGGKNHRRGDIQEVTATKTHYNKTNSNYNNGIKRNARSGGLQESWFEQVQVVWKLSGRLHAGKHLKNEMLSF